MRAKTRHREKGEHKTRDRDKNQNLKIPTNKDLPINLECIESKTKLSHLNLSQKLTLNTITLTKNYQDIMPMSPDDLKNSSNIVNKSLELSKKLLSLVKKDIDTVTEVESAELSSDNLINPSAIFNGIDLMSPINNAFSKTDSIVGMISRSSEEEWSDYPDISESPQTLHQIKEPTAIGKSTPSNSTPASSHLLSLASKESKIFLSHCQPSSSNNTKMVNPSTFTGGPSPQSWLLSFSPQTQLHLNSASEKVFMELYDSAMKSYSEGSTSHPSQHLSSFTTQTQIVPSSKNVNSNCLDLSSCSPCLKVGDKKSTKTIQFWVEHLINIGQSDLAAVIMSVSNHPDLASSQAVELISMLLVQYTRKKSSKDVKVTFSLSSVSPKVIELYRGIMKEWSPQ